MILLASIVSFAGCRKAAPEKRVVRIAAAADLTTAFGELGKTFAAKTGITPELTFAASGMLEKQIEQGAPFFLFAAANKDYVDRAIKAGKCDRASERIYARGQLVVWTAPGKPAPATLEDLAKPEFKKIAIANPETAPYGKAAKEALETAAIYDQVKDRLVLGENVLAALAYAKDGNADAAIVALSLAMETKGARLAISPRWFSPLDQALVVCGTGPEADAARQFADFVTSMEGRQLMVPYGFSIPPEHIGDHDGERPAPPPTQ
ncbi:MAG TPA: molybdate ABC transporter substrate-binding protein [Kofleriaceae bacterium]|jgi:molybdate transport system substrate-binding protein